MLSKFSYDDNDNVTYDVSFANNTNTQVPIDVTDTRNIPILENPEEYECAVISFSVPSSSLPLMIFEQASTAPDYSQGYWITIRDPTGAGTEITRPVLYNPKQNVNGATNALSPYNLSVDSYVLFTHYVNQTLATIWSLLPPASIAGKQIPFISYDSSTQLFSLIVDATLIWFFGDDTSLVTWNIWFNIKLQNIYLFTAQNKRVPTYNSSPAFSPKDYEIMFLLDYVLTLPPTTYANLAAGNNVYLLRQEYQTLFRFTFINKILFQSYNLPIVQDFFNNTAITQSTSTSQPILIDFTLQDEYLNKSDYIFQPQVLRWIPMRRGKSITVIDIKVKFQAGSVTNVFDSWLNPNENFSLKLLFRKKYKLVKVIQNKEENKQGGCKGGYKGGYKGGCKCD